MEEIKQKIDKLVSEYSGTDAEKNIYRLELEILVMLAEREQMKKDHEEVLDYLA